MVRISIVIPAWNAERHLRACLESCVRQSERAIEVICVDDGSADSTAAIADRFASGDERIKVIRLGLNRGTHLARKAGVLAAKGEFVLPLDADDFLEERACESLWAATENGRWDFILYGIRPILEDGASARLQAWADRLSGVCKGPSVRWTGGDYLRDAFVSETVPIFPAGKLFRRTVLQKVFRDLPDGRCIGPEDGLMLYRFMCGDVRGRTISDHLYAYRMGDGISTSEGMSLPQRRRWLTGGAFCFRALRGLVFSDRELAAGVRRCLVERPLDLALGGLSRRERFAVALSCASDVPLPFLFRLLLKRII